MREYIGAYAAVLGGLDGVVFGGGVGEHAPAMRAGILAGMEWLGIRLDAAANTAASGPPRLISAAGSPCAVWVFSVDEATELARIGQGFLTDAG